MTFTRKQASWLFALTVALVYSVIYLVGRSSHSVSHPNLVNAAALFDLTITVPAAFYFLLTKHKYASQFALAGVALAGLRSAVWLLPSLNTSFLSVSKWAGVPLELLIVFTVVRRVRSASTGDALARVREAASAVIPYQWLARIVAAELGVFYYALFSWKSKPATNVSGRVFSCGEASGYGTFGTLLIVMLVCEGVPMHFVLVHYHPVSAWILTAMTLYSLLWAVAVARSTRLRPIVVDDEWLKIRIGILREIDVPREAIRSVQRIGAGQTWQKKPGHFQGVVLNSPQFLIELARPIQGLGPYGLSGNFTQIGLAVDEPKAFASAMNFDTSRERK